jgi:uncharacterized membrane protein YedE/YeeE
MISVSPTRASKKQGEQMAAFDPISALIGGVLVGLASSLLMLLVGRIAGISGIFGGSLTLAAADKSWRLAFIAGLIAAPVLSGLFGHPLPTPQMPSNWLLIAAAGVLVGFGARLGGGCTSGHGVCGVARLSQRSILATVLFMASAVVTVAIVRHGIGG